MRADLHTHPKVVRISSALKADRLRVIGGLHAVWCLFDAHSVDGELEGYTPQALDDLIGWPGFAASMIAVKWLEETGESLATPRFDEHNGQSAKRRAQETERKRLAREEEEMSAGDADKKRAREEKRREELKTLEAFGVFWKAYPKKKNKGQAEKVWVKLSPDSDLLQTILNAVEGAARSADWLKNDGQYIPFPATWLNAKGWEDETPGSSGKPWEN